MAGSTTLNLRLVDNFTPTLKKVDASTRKFNKTVDASKGKLERAKGGLFGFGKQTLDLINSSLELILALCPRFCLVSLGLLNL